MFCRAMEIGLLGSRIAYALKEPYLLVYPCLGLNPIIDSINLSHVISPMGRINEPRREKTVFCICENKGADQLCGNRKADQRLCFRYTDSTIPLLAKSEVSSLYSSSVAVQPGLCRTWSETPKTGFLTTRLK